MQKNKVPLVSVIIPTYKRSETLPCTIESVLNQTYPYIEIIVVDDNGAGTEFQLATEDRLKKYIETEKIIYIKHTINKNGSAARNTGFNVCHGEYINFMDDDDIMLNDKITTQIDILAQSSRNVGACYCNSKIIRIQNLTHKRKVSYTHNKKEGNICREYLMNECPFNTSTILFKREVVIDLCGFDESFQRHQDYEMLTRFFCKYDIVCAGEKALVLYDMTKDRMNVPNSEKDFAIKKKFLSTFEKTFSHWGVRDTIFHYFWIQSALVSLLNRDYKIFKSALCEAKKAGLISFSEFFLLTKGFMVGLINK